jgi:8-amino-7-oxononanoate synthase
MPDWMDDDLAERRALELYRTRQRLDSSQGIRAHIDGRDYLSFSSNDYLNLAGDPRLARSAARAMRHYGTGAGASPLVSGYLTPLARLERVLARWEGAESALVFNSGFLANLAVVSSVAGENGVVFSDESNHASLIDGCRLARAPVHVFRHGDVNHLESLLRRNGSEARCRLIVTDTVFSMDGDFAPLAELIEVAERHDCLLHLDEAHATGVLGPGGRGLIELLPPSLHVDPDRVIRVGTLSKALGSQGGFVSGTRRLVEWLINHARPYIFSTALAPPCAAAARRALRIVKTQPERREHLARLSVLLREELVRTGYPPSASRCQIVPLIAGSAQEALAISGQLMERGILCPAIRPPSVPEGSARLRISLTAGHSEGDVARLVEALRELRVPLCQPSLT